MEGVTPGSRFSWIENFKVGIRPTDFAPIAEVTA